MKYTRGKREREMHMNLIYVDDPPTSSSSQSTVCITAASAHKPREVYNFFPFSYGGSEPTGIPDGETIPSPLKINIFFFQPFLSFFVLRKRKENGATLVALNVRKMPVKS
jgi:hypothetical protein